MSRSRAVVPARFRHRLDPWLVAQAGVALLVLLPVLGLAIEAARGSEGFWAHLAVNVLPRALQESLLLLLGVGAIAVLVGTGTAWLVSAYRFPGSAWLDWALLLPLAMPTYVIAYAYLDVLHPIGPVQTALRAVLGIDGPRGLRLPDIRSMTGCILVLGCVLYPYVYLTTRAVFLMQAASQIEAARLLGRGGVRRFATVALPLARPAIAVGASLALLEALNDVGAAEFLGVRTLTVSVYTTWVTRSDLPGAAQLSLVMLAIVLLLILLERRGRARQRHAGDGGRVLVPERLRGAKAALAVTAGLVPIALGFVVPVSYLVVEAIKRLRFSGLPETILAETLTTLALSLTATAIAVLLGLLVACAPRLTGGSLVHGLARLASIGYALPGTVLAIGLLMPLGAADRAIDGAARLLFGITTGLVFLGSSAALILAYVTRFLAIPIGGIEAGLGRVPGSLDQAARLLGQDGLGVLRRIHLPLARPAIATAALLVFVDCMKELPATLLLRPLNVETLATHLYGEAARGTYEDGAIAALLIVLVGLLPVMALARIGRPSALR